MTKQAAVITWRKILLTTVAGGVLLTGCSSIKETFSRDGGRKDQQARISGEMRRPASNPNAMTGEQYALSSGGEAVDGGRRPSNNPGGAIGTPAVDMSAEPEMAPMESTHAAPAAARKSASAKKSGGFFSFLYRDDASSENLAIERRVPAGNNDRSAAPAADGAASFEAAVPVEGVESAQLADVSADYPDLSNVPAAPGGLSAAEKKDAMMVDLSASRDDMLAQQATLNSQVASDASDPFAPAPQTAPVALDGSAVPVAASGENLEAEFAALVAAPGAAPSATPQVAADGTPIIMGSPPRPLDQQIAMAAPADSAPAWSPEPQIAPQTGGEEWVDVRGELVNQAVPVEGVAVSAAAEPIAVSPIPVVPNWNAGGIALNQPGAAGIRTLPDSRYAARRQATASQRYARQQQMYGGY